MTEYNQNELLQKHSHKVKFYECWYFFHFWWLWQISRLGGGHGGAAWQIYGGRANSPMAHPTIWFFGTSSGTSLYFSDDFSEFFAIFQKKKIYCAIHSIAPLMQSRNWPLSCILNKWSVPITKNYLFTHLIRIVKNLRKRQWQHKTGIFLPPNWCLSKVWICFGVLLKWLRSDKCRKGCQRPDFSEINQKHPPIRGLVKTIRDQWQCYLYIKLGRGNSNSEIWSYQSLTVISEWSRCWEMLLRLKRNIMNSFL